MTKFLTITAVLLSTMIGSDAAAMQLGERPPPRPHPEPQWEPNWEPHWAAEGRWIGPCEGWWLGENLTPAVWNENPERGETMMMRLIVCTFAIFAPGESAYALAIADRESGFYPFALNESSGASGLFQHIASYWPGRAAAYLERSWFGKGAWPASVFDPRANAIAAAKMVAASGWGAWSTA